LWLFFGQVSLLGPRPSGWLLVIAVFAGSLDFYDFFLRLYFRRQHTRLPEGSGFAPTSVPLDVGTFSPYQIHQHLKPWAVIVSVHNAEEELDDFLEAIEPYRDHLWVIDDASTDDTAMRLQQAGVRCLRGTTNRKKPGALKDLIGTLDPDIATVVVLDPDSRILGPAGSHVSDLERVIFEFQRSQAAAMSPRIAVREDGILARLQGLEYWVSFSLGRGSLKDHCTTSGVAIYRRDALARLLQSHTLSIYAEDLKNAFLLLGNGDWIYHESRLVVETLGARTWRGWFSQRVGWYFGLIKVYSESFDNLLRTARGKPFFTYHFLVYTGVFTLLLHPIKLLSFALMTSSLAGGLDALLGLGLVPAMRATEPTYFLLAYMQYAVFAVVALFVVVERGERLRLAPAVPFYFFYSVLQTLPVTLGYLNWFSMRHLGFRFFKDHYQDETTLRRELYLGAR